MKICFKCKKELNMILFSKNKNNKDGFENWCKQCVKEKYSLWRKKNVKHESERKKEWRKNNLDYDKKRKAKWSSENLEKRRLSYHKRRAYLLNSDVFFISKKEIKKILSSECFMCKSKKNITIDHIIPISKGGRHSIGNLMPLCLSCNTSKCDKYLIEWKNT